MKFFHLSDLHIGKSVNGISMEEEQIHILNQILNFIDIHKPDALIIAGDIYDKSSPSNRAIKIFDEFLTQLAQKNIPILCISGNHDSAERLSFANRIMKTQNIFIEGTFNGFIKPIDIKDNYGIVHFYLLPFIRPIHVRSIYKDDEIKTYIQAIQAILSKNPINKNERNVLIAHQFVVPTQGELERSESEVEPIGTVDAVSSTLFEDFDYVALGHIHRPQKVGKDFIRYAGSPLKYSFSEINHTKSISVIELKEKGDFLFSNITLTSIHNMRKIRGPLLELTSEALLQGQDTQDYMHVTLTDETEVIDAIGKLRACYPNLMELAFDNSRTRHVSELTEITDIKKKSPLELFETFYNEQNGKPLTEEEKSIVTNLLENMELSL